MIKSLSYLCQVEKAMFVATVVMTQCEVGSGDTSRAVSGHGSHHCRPSHLCTDNIPYKESASLKHFQNTTEHLVNTPV